MAETTKVELVPVEAVSAGYLQRFDTPAGGLVLACGEEGPVAMWDVCPHAGGRLSGGRVAGNRVRCPRHGYLFNLSTGVCPRGEEEGFGALSFVELKQENEHFVVELTKRG